MLDLNAWKRIDTNSVVINWIKDSVEFDFDKPLSPFYFENKKHSSHEHLFLQTEIRQLLNCGYIEKTVDSSYISPISCVPKKNSDFRLVINLRHLIKHCCQSYHKIEDIRHVAEIIKPDDVLTSIDLKDSFYHFKIKKSFRKYLSFKFENNFYSFCVLPFGFCLSPFFHAKILKPVTTFLRDQGVRLNLYVDDFLILAEYNKFRDHTDLVLHTLSDLGLHINFEKSELDWANQLQYLGYHIDTSKEFPIIKVDKKRIIRLKKQIRCVIKKQFVSAKVLAKTAGLCVSTAFAVTPAKLFLRNTYRVLSTRASWEDNHLELSNACLEELHWWLNSAETFNFKEIKHLQIDNQLKVDASGLCWGAVLNSSMEAKGDWNARVSCQSSNYRELLAILLALDTFQAQLTGKAVEILSDNATAGAYLRNKGGPVRSLAEMAKTIWGIAERHQIQITCTHIPGVLNVEADRLSRTPDTHNWMLHPYVFTELQKRLGPFTVDRFATSLNAQLPRFNSRYWEPETEAVNALAQHWGGEHNFINPPWALLPQIVRKIAADKAECTVIAPLFRGQAWYQELKKMCIQPPIILPKGPYTQLYVGPRPEPMKNKHWTIAAWRVSGNLT